MNNNNTTSRPLNAVAALVMVGLCLSWGMNQVSVKLTLPEIPPFIQATVRSIGAFAVIAIWARWRGVSLTVRDGTLIGGLAAGALFGIEFLLIFPALQFTAASRATLFIYTAPFFVAIGSTVLSAKGCAPCSGPGCCSRSPVLSWRSACRMRRATGASSSVT